MRRAMQCTVNRIVVAIALACALASPSRLSAQNLGPFRQFLALEPYYAYTRLDAGTDNTVGLQGFGTRLWLNTAPFGLTDKLGVGIYATRSPVQSNRGASIWHYGAQLELFPVHRPIGGFLDPFLTVGGGVFHTKTVGGEINVRRGVENRFTLVPGGGIRIPIPNRFQLRFDVRDAIVFDSPLAGTANDRQTGHNLELNAALGLTF